MGAQLATAFVDSITNFISANNELMSGQSYLSTGDIRTYLDSGAFVNFQGVDEEAVIAKSRDMLASIAINYLWKQQKIFIMGGGPCDDSGGIGQGPQNAKLCRNGQAWYLFFWREYGGIHLFSKKQWGNVDVPPGFPQLGTGDYTNITVQDVISSSLDAYLVGGNNYTYDQYLARTQSSVATGFLNASTAGPSLEGTFSIPVCNISGVIPVPAKNFAKKSVVLQPWGGGMIPTWCNPICTLPNGTLSRQLTLDWVAAAQMTNFDSFTTYCPGNQGDWTGW